MSDWVVGCVAGNVTLGLVLLHGGVVPAERGLDVALADEALAVGVDGGGVGRPAEGERGGDRGGGREAEDDLLQGVCVLLTFVVFGMPSRRGCQVRSMATPCRPRDFPGLCPARAVC